jgi:hypothetical protein
MSPLDRTSGLNSSSRTNRSPGGIDATIFATEEAIINAFVAAETMIGIDGLVVEALPSRPSPRRPRALPPALTEGVGPGLAGDPADQGKPRTPGPRGSHTIAAPCDGARAIQGQALAS